MSNLAILNPVLLRKLVQEFDTPENLTLLNKVTRIKTPSRIAEWDIMRGARNIAEPNVPNSEANVVDRLGRTRATASMTYVREKKVFTETTLRWIRDFANSPSDLTKTNAEAQIKRETQDLNTRLDNLAEYQLWRALTGELDVVSDKNGVKAQVDYGFDPANKPNVSIDWSNATPMQIVADVRAFINQVQFNGLVQAKTAYTSGSVLDMIIDAFAHHGTAPTGTTQPVNFSGGRLMSDRMKDQYYATGAISGFMGLDWSVQDNVFDPTGSSYTTSPTTPGQEKRFLDKNSIIIGNFDNDTVQLMEGETADSEAPYGFIGKFAKSYVNHDPAGRTVLLEWTFLPIINRPDQLVYVKDVTNPNAQP